MDGGIDRCHLSKGHIIVNDERQEWISKRAYGLWEAEGRPQGKDEDHWDQAARERADLEKVALPEHAARHNSHEADDATRAAVDLTRQSLPEDSEEEASLHH
jgi:hypothetical protein